MSGDKCGLYGIITPKSYPEFKSELNNSLVKLQHRGQESYGISYKTLTKQVTTKRLGLVDPTYIEELSDNFCSSICHVRYSTSKNSKNQTLERKLQETQPFQSELFTLAHNGNIPHKVQAKLIKHYNIKQKTDSDSETLLKLIEQFSKEYHTIKDALIKLVNTVEGVYNLLIQLQDGTIYALRDRHGVRPLTIAQSHYKETLYVSSETCAFPTHASVIRDVNAGEIIKITPDIYETVYQFKTPSVQTFCSFEYIYFMRPQSSFAGLNVQDLRYRMGQYLARTEPKPINTKAIVIGMPNTAIPVGQGFASLLGLPYEQYIEKMANCGRTFILPDNADRLQRLRNKFLFSPKLKDAVIYLCDDSVVRGNTMRELIQLLKTEHKVKEVHVRVSSPPVIDICHYGIDIPDKETLIGAAYSTTEEIQKSIKADSLIYLPIEAMKGMMETKQSNVCTSCFTGDYDKRLLDW